MLVTGWGASSMDLHMFYPVGELHKKNNKAYMADAHVGSRSTIDVIGLCNDGASGVACVDNLSGNDLTVRNTADHGYIADLPGAGRAIIHIDNSTISGEPLEVFFTCPDCGLDTKAYWGTSSNDFLGRGFYVGSHHSGSSHVDLQPAPESYALVASNLTGTAWRSITHATTYLHGTGLVYWVNGGSSCTPDLNVQDHQYLSNNPFVWDRNACKQGGNPGASYIMSGAVAANKWQPLTPGWNSVPAPNGKNFILTVDPGSGAKMQVRTGAKPCCVGFDGGVTNKINSGVVVHDIDRHLLIIPRNGHIPYDHPALSEMRTVRDFTRQDVYNTARLLAHSDPGDPIYHGLLYAEHGGWPPYKVREVAYTKISFEPPDNTELLLAGLTGFGWSAQETQYLLNIKGMHQGMLDSQIYDVRNDRQLLTDKGSFKLMNDTVVQREYILPWLNIRNSPVWEMYGVHLPEDRLLIVDLYATVPITKPTSLHDVYLSSIPCGDPDLDDNADLLNATARALQYTGSGYDRNLLSALFVTSTEVRLQHIYEASRTYLDYLDGVYDTGDDVHVPILPNRPYLCVTVPPNILESQYLVHGLPLASSYVSIGGTDGAAHVAGVPVGESAVLTRTVGVQSPRDGIVSLDISANIGASVGMLAHAPPITGNHTGQWANGTLIVTAGLYVGDMKVKDGKPLPLTEFTVDLYEMADEAYVNADVTDDGALNERCYGRFVTEPDDSGYVVKTFTVAAKHGDHIPVTLEISTKQDPAAPLVFNSTRCYVANTESTVMHYILNTFTVDVR